MGSPFSFKTTPVTFPAYKESDINKLHISSDKVCMIHENKAGIVRKKLILGWFSRQTEQLK